MGPGQKHQAQSTSSGPRKEVILRLCQARLSFSWAPHPQAPGHPTSALLTSPLPFLMAPAFQPPESQQGGLHPGWVHLPSWLPATSTRDPCTQWMARRSVPAPETLTHLHPSHPQHFVGSYRPSSRASQQLPLFFPLLGPKSPFHEAWLPGPSPHALACPHGSASPLPPHPTPPPPLQGKLSSSRCPVTSSQPSHGCPHLP